MEHLQQDANCSKGLLGRGGGGDAGRMGLDTSRSREGYGLLGAAQPMERELTSFAFCLLQIIKDGEEHADLNEVAKLFNIHEE